MLQVDGGGGDVYTLLSLRVQSTLYRKYVGYYLLYLKKNILYDAATPAVYSHILYIVLYLGSCITVRSGHLW